MVFSSSGRISEQVTNTINIRPNQTLVESLSLLIRNKQLKGVKLINTFDLPPLSLSPSTLKDVISSWPEGGSRGKGQRAVNVGGSPCGEQSSENAGCSEAARRIRLK